jgi:hypothetical protein
MDAIKHLETVIAAWLQRAKRPRETTPKMERLNVNESGT